VDYLRVALTFLLLTQSAYADWYILLPKSKRPQSSTQVKKPPLPKLGKKEVKPYRVEVRRIVAPSFTLYTPDFKRVSLEELQGKTVVILFVKNLFTPQTEALVKEFESFGKEGVAFIVIDANDADFAAAKSFKELLNLKKVVVTADSYAYKEFKERIKELSIPSIVVIDRYGFIRFFSPKVSTGKVEVVKRELSQIVRELQEAQTG